MTDESTPGDAKAFAAYAEFDIRRWQLIRGERLVHSVFGDGVIQGIASPTKKSITISVHFANYQSKRLCSTIFRNPTVVTSLTAPESVWRKVEVQMKENDERAKQAAQLEAEKKHRSQHLRKKIEIQIRAHELQRREAQQRRQERARELEQRRLERERKAELQREEEEQRRREVEKQKAREAESAAEFAHLKRKYYAETYRDRSPISPLYLILQTIDQHDVLSKDDLSWLEEERLAGPLGFYYEIRYHTTNSFSLLLKACSKLRQARRPKHVLGLTSQVDTIEDPEKRSKLLTTRGGAFRDLNQLDDAEQCANQAISLSRQNSYPYRLRGKVLFQRGQAQQGYDDFLEADRLDEMAGTQTSGKTQKDMENALKKANQLDQRHVAEFLIRKDPSKYEWARYYLDHPRDEDR